MDPRQNEIILFNKTFGLRDCTIDWVANTARIGTFKIDVDAFFVFVKFIKDLLVSVEEIQAPKNITFYQKTVLAKDAIGLILGLEQNKCYQMTIRCYRDTMKVIQFKCI